MERLPSLEERVKQIGHPYQKDNHDWSPKKRRKGKRWDNLDDRDEEEDSICKTIQLRSSGARRPCSPCNKAVCHICNSSGNVESKKGKRWKRRKRRRMERNILEIVIRSAIVFS